MTGVFSEERSDNWTSSDDDDDVVDDNDDEVVPFDKFQMDLSTIHDPNSPLQRNKTLDQLANRSPSSPYNFSLSSPSDRKRQSTNRRTTNPKKAKKKNKKDQQPPPPRPASDNRFQASRNKRPPLQVIRQTARNKHDSYKARNAQQSKNNHQSAENMPSTSREDRLNARNQHREEEDDDNNSQASNNHDEESVGGGDDDEPVVDLQSSLGSKLNVYTVKGKKTPKGYVQFFENQSVKLPSAKDEMAKLLKNWVKQAGSFFVGLQRAEDEVGRLMEQIKACDKLDILPKNKQDQDNVSECVSTTIFQRAKFISNEGEKIDCTTTVYDLIFTKEDKIDAHYQGMGDLLVMTPIYVCQLANLFDSVDWSPNQGC